MADKTIQSLKSNWWHLLYLLTLFGINGSKGRTFDAQEGFFLNDWNLARRKLCLKWWNYPDNPNSSVLAEFGLIAKGTSVCKTGRLNNETENVPVLVFFSVYGKRALSTFIRSENAIANERETMGNKRGIA